MKVLILVQSVDRDRYPELVQMQKNTWDSVDNPNTQTLYFYPGKETSLSGNELRVRGGYGYPFMFNQCIAALKECLKLDWDYIFKTDNSAYVHKEQLVRVLQDKPREEYYGGQSYYTDHPDTGRPFLWGEGMILSRDVVEFLVHVYGDMPGLKYGAEDIHIGAILYNRFKWDTNMHVYQFYKNMGKMLAINHVYRCSNDQPGAVKFTDELSAMARIHEALTH